MRGLTLLDSCRRQAIALKRKLTPAEATVRPWLSNIAAKLQQDG